MPNQHKLMDTYLQTGQMSCHDAGGLTIDCPGSGQDAEFKRGLAWPVPRFEVLGDMVIDELTGLVWARDANLAGFPLPWQEALEFIATMNQDHFFGAADWRLPNRRELRSLISHQTREPALPAGHPFVNLFTGWYWTSTTAAINTAYAWYVNMAGGRMFYGHKEQSCLLWPVRDKGETNVLATGQSRCHDTRGQLISCAGSGQDGAFRAGRPWPEPRFEQTAKGVVDRLTNLCWQLSADLTAGPVTWEEALMAVSTLNQQQPSTSSWRLPNINELESVVDCSRHSPALPLGHPFTQVRQEYWSATTSMFEPDWAWALYLTKGAIGVGQKSMAHFSVWAVCDFSPS